MLVGPVAGLVDTVLKRVLPPEKMSDSERAHLEAEMRLAIQNFDWQSVLGQLEINKQEAKHTSLFIAGWRPGMGWVGVIGMAYHMILAPVVAFTITLMKWEVPPLPVFDMETLSYLVFGMLGLGTMRTAEKWKNVEGNR
jgi:hypothetical protein